MQKAMRAGGFICCFFALLPLAAQAQLVRNEVRDLQEKAVRQGWTFKVGENEATRKPLAALCGLVEPAGWQKKAKFLMPRLLSPPPSRYDARTQGAGLPPIRNQGSCGSCWAFATMGALECAIQLAGSGTQDLAEQWLVSCNQSGWGCGGGWFAHDYHVLNGGLRDQHNQNGAPYESDFPYVQSDASCVGPYAHRYWISDWGYIGSQGGVPTVDQIKQAIITYGPVACAVYVGSAFSAYSGGIYNNNETRTVNHAVVLVGWDDNNGEGYWILRNSWGTSWGESGYMRIRYDCNNVGYAACYVVYDKGSAWQVTPTDDFTTSGPAGGPFSQSCKTYTIRNDGAAALAWSSQSSAAWLTITPSSGSIPPLSTRDVSICVNSAANSLRGFHEATVTFTNATAGVSAHRRVAISAGVTDHYTESFETTGNDSDYAQYLLTPASGGYTVCRRTITALPITTTGAQVLSLSDDGSQYIALSGGKTFSFAGANRSGVWINANGNLTFSAGDSSYSESAANHFALARVAALYDDLNPEAGGQVYVQQLTDRLVASWVEIPEYGQSNANTFQVELFFDGSIQVSFLQVDAPDGILGLSAGQGIPAGFVPTDYRAYPLCAGGEADLALLNLTAAPATVSAKAFTACAFTITNRGPTAIDAEFLVVDYYLSANTTFGDGDDVKIGDTGFALTMGVGASMSLSLSATGLGNMTRLWTADLACGVYYLFASVRVEDSFPVDGAAANNHDRTDATLTLSGSACVQNNDLCSSASPLSAGGYVTASTAGATQDATPGRGLISRGLWFTFTPSQSGSVTVDTCSSDFDTVIEVMTGSCDALISVGNNDDDPNGTCYLASRVSFLGVAGTTYRICAGGYGGAYGTLHIRATLTGADGPSITTACPLPGGMVGTAYARTLTATGGRAPYRWTLGGGGIPGLSLSTAGVLSGMPDYAGTYDILVRVEDADGAYDEAACRIAFAPAGPAGQTFAARQPAIGYASKDWSFMSAWNLSTGVLELSPDWYEGNKTFQFTLADAFQWVAIFVYDDGTAQTRELRWFYRQMHIQ